MLLGGEALSLVYILQQNQISPGPHLTRKLFMLKIAKKIARKCKKYVNIFLYFFHMGDVGM